MPTILIHLLNEHQVAEALGVSVSTVRRWRLFGRGPEYIKVGDTLVRYKSESVAEFLQSCATGGGKGSR